MGEVSRATDTRLDRTVAVKVLPEHLAQNPEFRQRFEREARAVSSLNHPHICVLYDIGRQDGIDFLVMEYLEGETLAARLARRPLPTPALLEYATQIAEALAAAHRQSVFHRDLKPGNVMLTATGAKLLDFGLARTGGGVQGLGGADLSALPTQLTKAGTILGTLHYMAPEQIEGKEADARSDLFAFGALVCEMATGRKAFDGKSTASVIAAIIDGPYSQRVWGAAQRRKIRFFRYTPSADGKRFLVGSQTETEGLPLTVVLNWAAGRKP